MIHKTQNTNIHKTQKSSSVVNLHKNSSVQKIQKITYEIYHKELRNYPKHTMNNCQSLRRFVYRDCAIYEGLMHMIFDIIPK